MTNITTLAPSSANALRKQIAQQPAARLNTAENHKLLCSSIYNCSQLDQFRAEAKRRIYLNESRAAEKWSEYFRGNSLPRISVLVRYPALDRAALIAHHRANELMNLTSAVKDGNAYRASLARNRLKRIEAIAQVFDELSE